MRSAPRRGKNLSVNRNCSKMCFELSMQLHMVAVFIEISWTVGGEMERLREGYDTSHDGILLIGE